MFFKITFIITIITLCSGAPPLLPKTNSNQATYSQSFVRKDVPISYQYSATHNYTIKKRANTPKGYTLKWFDDIPNRYEVPYKDNTVINHNDSRSTSLSNHTLQFTPLHSSSREYTHPTPVLYTSILPEPAYTSAKMELTEIPAKLPLHLQPEQMIMAGPNVGPTTYKPHLNHDIKMYRTHHSHLLPTMYEETTSKLEKKAAPIYKMADVHHLSFFHELQRQLAQQPKYHITSTTVKNPKLSHRVNLGVRSLPRLESPFEFDIIPQELNRNTPFQPIPRVAYNNMFNVVPEKLGPQQMPTRNNKIHLS